MKSFVLLFALLSTDPALADLSWSCDYTLSEPGANQPVEVKSFLSSEKKIKRQAISSSRGPIMAEVQVEQDEKGQWTLYPKLRFVMDRIPSASMPAEQKQIKGGVTRFETSLQVRSVQEQGPVKVKLVCEQDTSKVQ